MAVFTYGASDEVTWSSFSGWHNSYSSNSNLSLNQVMDNLEPADSAPHQASELRGNSFLYGTVHCSGASGNIQVTAGYSTPSSTTNFNLSNVNFNSVSSVTITATATYPVYLEGFYSAANGGGTLLQNYDEPTTSGTITLTSSTFTSYENIYAYFVDAHA
jgi:hypothetical protein